MINETEKLKKELEDIKSKKIKIAEMRKLQEQISEVRQEIRNLKPKSWLYKLFERKY